MRIYHEQVECGCFVYQVVRTDSHIQPAPFLEDQEEEEEEDDQFEDGELLAVDMIQPSDTAIFVRLADQSGWVAAEIRGETFLRQVPVRTNILIQMVADVPQMVRRHPMDESSALLSSELCSNSDDENSGIWHLQPMQTVYCDAMVEHPDTGIRFYRIQGAGSDAAPATPGWIHDQTLDGECRLLASSKIQRNHLYAFTAVRDTVVRERPDCTDSSKSPIKVGAGDIVVADLIRESPATSGNGPFVRLTDGSGWLFCKKLHEVVLRQVPILSGHWIFTVLNDPIGINQYEQPGRGDMPTGVTYRFGSVIECDKCIESSTHGNYFHVIGSPGWICDKENGRRCLSLLQELEVKPELFAPWSVDFVRGIVVAASTTTQALVEIMYDEHAGLLALQCSDDLHFKIFCHSRTVGVFYRIDKEPLRKQFHINCEPEQLVQILSRSLEDTSLFYQQQAVSPKLSGVQLQSENWIETPKSLRVEEEKKDDIEEFMEQQQQHQDQQQQQQHSAEQNVVSRDAATEYAGKMAEEDELRRHLLQLDAQMLEMQIARRKLIGSLKPFDTERDAEALLMKNKMERRQQDNRQKHFQHQSSAAQADKSKRSSRKKSSSRVKSISPKSSESNVVPVVDEASTMSSAITSFSRQQGATVIEACAEVDEEEYVEENASSFRQSSSRNLVRCRECSKEFSGKYSRDLHCRNVHKLYCEHCDKIFHSFKELELHIEAENHW